MSSKTPHKDKDGSLPEMLKKFFGLSRERPPAIPVHQQKPKVEFTLTPAIIKDISKESQINNRLKTIKDLMEIVANKHLENNAVESLCLNTCDLLHPQKPAEVRQAVLKFHVCLIQGQCEKLSIMRAYFFRLIKEYNVSEDNVLRFEMFKALTHNGKSINYFEEEAGPFLLEWMPEIIQAGKSAEFLMLLVNVIKFNASYLDRDIISGFVQNTCKHLSSTKNEDDVYQCFDILDAVVCYSYLPSEALTHFITALCNTVNAEKFLNKSWKLMRNLLGTHLGHSGISTMCRLIQDPSNLMDCELLRGAIFFVSLSLWGSERIKALKHKPDVILPSFRQALDCGNPYVAYEVVLSIQRLLKTMNKNLHLITWDVILDITEKLIAFPEVQNVSPPSSVLGLSVHELVSAIEQLHEDGLYNGDTERMYDIIEKLSAHRPDKSVLKLICYRSEFLDSTKENWIPSLKYFVEKYFKHESRPTVKIHALEVFKNVMDCNRHFFEDELIDHIAIPFVNFEPDQDLRVKIKVIKVLIDLARHCNSKRCLEILDAIEKIVSRCCDNVYSYCTKLENIEINVEDEVSALHCAIQGIIDIFKKKLFVSPSCYAVQCYKILKAHLLAHFSSGNEFLNYTSSIREDIFLCLLELQANSLGQLGIADASGKPSFSPYIYVAFTKGSSPQSCSESMSPPLLSPSAGLFQPFTPSYICLKELSQCIVLCLQQENDWPVLKVILTELPKFLLHKSILLCCANGINDLCDKLCLLIRDKNCGNPEKLRRVPQTFSRSEFQLYVFPVLSGLTAYHRELEPAMQCSLISSLEQGLASKCAPLCISVLTLCTLEMQETMYKLLPRILLSLSKISSTVTVALPNLEFLSNLIRLPNLYASFVGDQYMSIFAIALPYTNPSKFNQYIVSLAHHVIAMWFLKCRIPFRKDFVRFITKGLHTNASVSRDETPSLTQSQTLTTESIEQRRRSSSLNNQSSRSETRTSNDSPTMSLHFELMETSMDLMARYTFGMCSSLPKRTSLMEFLLEKGQSLSWLLGNQVITITTSGCSSTAYKGGLCDKCYYLCAKDSLHDDEPPIPQPVTPATGQQLNRRRHRSAIQPSTIAEARMLSPRTRDDSNIPQPYSADVVKSPKLFSSGSSSAQEGSGVLLYSGDSLHSTPSQTESPNKSKSKLCGCWCQGWAEIHIRRPTGNTSWMMRIQNELFPGSEVNEFPLPDLATLFKHMKLFETMEENPEFEDVSLNPAPEKEQLDESSKYEESEWPASISEREAKAEQEALQSPSFQNTTRSSSPFRRTNSSPEMKPEVYSPGSADIQKDNQSLSMPEQPETPKSSGIPEKTLNDDLPLSKSDTRTKLHLDLSLIGNKRTGASPSSPGGFEKKAKSPPRSPPTRKPFMSHRDRVHTISVMSPVRYQPGSFSSASSIQQASSYRDAYRHGLSPKFVFLQLYHTNSLGMSTERPILLPKTDVMNRSLNVLDHIPPYETHKIGVVYVGPGQATNESAILSNKFGSSRYNEFLQGLGTLICLKDVNPQKTYIGGLELNGKDGKFAYSWQDDIMQVIFHVATLMPNKEKDPNCTDKKCHIGNDFVTIVYNNSGEDYDICTIKGQLTYACIIIHPGEYNSNIVLVKAKEDLIGQIGHSKPQIISDDSLSIFVRQLALHADLASVIWNKQHSSSKDPYVSNWLERLRLIKRLRAKVTAEMNSEVEDDSAERAGGLQDAIAPEDFTSYT